MASTRRSMAGLTLPRSVVGPMAVLAAISLGAAGLRLYHLGYKPLWFDEAVVYGFSQVGLNSLLSVNAHQNFAPPLFVFLLHFVSALGKDEFMLRLFPCLAGVACVPAVFVLARRYMSSAAALVCSFLVAVATVQVEFSQQVREYSLAFLLSCMILLAYSLYSETLALKHWLFLVLASIVAVWTQYGLVLLVLATNLMAVLRLAQQEGRRRFVVGWGLAQACVLVAALIVYFTTLRYQFRPGQFGFLERGYWSGQIAHLPGFLYGQTYEILLFSFPESALFILAALTGALAQLTSRQGRLSLVQLSFPFAVAALAGMLQYYPYTGTRHSLYLTPIVYLLAGMGFDYLLAAPSKRIAAAVLLVMLARGAALSDWAYLRSEGIENIRPVVKYLEENVLPDDQVFVCQGAVPAFDYYFHSAEANVTRAGPGEEWQNQLEKAIATGDRLWLVATHCGDVSTYTDFIITRSRALEEAASAYQAWLYVAP